MIYYLYLGSILFFVILINYDRFDWQEKVYDFFQHDKIKNISIYVIDFFINLGSNISAVSVGAIFIPIPNVTFLTLLSVFIFGIIIAISASCVKKFIKDREWEI
jgi:hypothetical protein